MNFQKGFLEWDEKILINSFVTNTTQNEPIRYNSFREITIFLLHKFIKIMLIRMLFNVSYHKKLAEIISHIAQITAADNIIS